MSEPELVQITWFRAIKVWWSLLWRGFLLWFFPCAIIGSVLIFFMEWASLEPATIQAVCVITGYILFIPAGIIVIKTVLGKCYADFRLVLAAR
ncbi:hypothetical protein ACFL4C_00925 [Candidatus Omnitrophota bacterium]